MGKIGKTGVRGNKEVKARVMSDLEKVTESVKNSIDEVWLSCSRLRNVLKTGEDVDPKKIEISQQILDDYPAEGTCSFFPKREIDYILSKQPKE